MKRLVIATATSLFLQIFSNSTASALSVDEFLGDGVASSSIANTPASTTTTNSSAIGGNRALYAVKSTNGAGTTRLETFPDPEFVGDTDYSLGYTQGAHTGLGIVTWDGDSSPTTLTYNGLSAAGVDFLQDAGTALLLGIKFYDYPANASIDLTIRVYDAQGAGGLKYSDLTVTLNQSMNFATPFVLQLPFSTLTTSGASTVVAPGNTTFATNTVFGPGGAVDLTKVGAIQLIINGLGNTSAPDLTLDFLKTNGICNVVPDANGKVIDSCGVCRGQPNYNLPKDNCGLCPADPNYQKSQDTCGICIGQPGYQTSLDACGLCPSANNYNNAKDPCGVCFGNGTTCADCTGTTNGSAKFDVCNVCNGNGTTCLDCKGVPLGTSKLDACGVCGGTAKSASECVTDQCVTVEATTDILAFEKRLVEQTKTITKKYKEEDKRNKKNKCAINTKPSTERVNQAYEVITAAGKDIFAKGVEICGEGCVTVSFADQVKALAPKLKIIEKETTTLAKKVQSCYKRKKIKTVQGVAGVATTIKDVNKELTQLIQDCKDKQICNK